MGKSTAQSILAARSIAVIDTDDLARLLVQPGQAALAEIESQFGGNFLEEDGTLKRGALAQLVFSDAAARERLESILHPRIRSHWESQVRHWREQGIQLGAVVIPLLFETDVASSFEATVCVACSRAAQHERLIARLWTEEVIQQRVAAQWPIAQKMVASDYAVWTDGDLETHAAQWDRILASLEVGTTKTGGHRWPPETKPS